MPQSKRFVVVTGLSGAGKSQALRILEDLGYYCVDNLPVPLVPTFADLVKRSSEERSRVAVCVDARTGKDLVHLPAHLNALEELGFTPDLLYLESSDSVLYRRYSESRRRHPCSPLGSIDEGIRLERELLSPIRERADLVIDTSAVTVGDLRERISTMFVGAAERRALTMSIMSFGFKYGLPAEADLVLDVRFLPNPHYDPDLQPMTGNDPEVKDYVMNQKAAEKLLHHVTGLLKFLIPQYANEPKSYLTIAIGCTGGRHRSVVIAQEVHRLVRDLSYEARLQHRDIAR